LHPESTIAQVSFRAFFIPSLNDVGPQLGWHLFLSVDSR
jgi:hypothetical protein